jgi:hypothetical protein
MKRNGLLIVLVGIPAAVAVALGACAAEPRSTDPKDPGDPASQPNQMHGVTLTPTAPRQDVTIAPAAGATTLSLTMATIDNPSSQAFSLTATLIWSGAGNTVEETIGTVSPYPATQPGSFVLTVPEAARKWLARSDGQLALRLALQAVAADRPLADPLRVTIGEPAWH